MQLDETPTIKSMGKLNYKGRKGVKRDGYDLKLGILG